jgi:hypothetical protein
VTTTTNPAPILGARRPAATIPLAPLIVLLVVLMAALSLLRLSPPAAVSADAPAGLFSSGRAMAHLREIAQRPHPTGSAENDRVRAYLVGQLEALGLDVEVQRAQSVAHSPAVTSAAVVQNVVTRIPGTDSTSALLLMAHYDSVPTSPGASDDGAGVVTILEVARALLAGPPLQNDVILLLTDGEEMGMLGARAFAAHHPWMANVRLALNLEARGSAGPVVLFQSSEANAGLITAYAGVAPHPVASSLLPAVYRLLPNDTDLTIFLREGVPGLNFAYADGWTSYHSGRDTVESLDERSVQHHGENVLALAQQFGNQDLRSVTSGSEDAVFFSLLSRWVVHYPQGWALPLLGLAALVLAGLVALGRARGRLTLRGIGLGTATVVGVIVALGGLGYGGLQALNFLEGGELSVFMGGTYHVHWYELGFLLLFSGVAWWLIGAASRCIQPLSLIAGTLLVWLALGLAAGLLLPGGSYLFTWPLFAGLAALAIQLLTARPALRSLAALLPGVVTVLVLTPAVYLVLVLAGINGALVLAAVVPLLLGLMLPALMMEEHKRTAPIWLPATALAGGGTALLLAIALSTGYDEAHPRQNMLFYSLDADSGQAAWVVAGQVDEPWAEHVTGAEADHAHLAEHFPVLSLIPLEAATGRAPVAELPAPEVTVLADTVDGDARTLRLRVTSQRGASEFALLLATPGGLLSTTLYGETIIYAAPLPEVMLNSAAVPPEGLELTLTLQPGQPLTLQVADVTPALPVLAEQPVSPRPASVTGVAGGFTPDDATVVQRRVVVPAQP